MPRIQQPRAAKSLDGGIVGKMNKLLDSKLSNHLTYKFDNKDYIGDSIDVIIIVKDDNAAHMKAV